MNEMYEYLKNHAYISYNKKSTYEFELSEERAECIANKYNSLTKELQQKVEQLENIRKEAYEFVEWHYKDNQKFYKNKGIGLNYPECDYLLNILNKFKGDNKEEIMKLFVDKYMWKPNTFGITEESHELLEVNAQVIMADQDYMKKIGGKE